MGFKSISFLICLKEKEKIGDYKRYIKLLSLFSSLFYLLLIPLAAPDLSCSTWGLLAAAHWGFCLFGCSMWDLEGFLVAQW